MRVESFRITEWEEIETGLIISENKNWVLVKYIPVDYQIDGYKLFRKAFVEERFHSSREKTIEKVLSLKNVNEEAPVGFRFSSTASLFDSTVELLRWSEKKYGLFEFQDENEPEVFYGKISQVTGNILTIDMIKSDGSVTEDYFCKFDLNEIRTITFESDYFTSIILLWEDRLKGNTLQNQ